MEINKGLTSESKIPNKKKRTEKKEDKLKSEINNKQKPAESQQINIQKKKVTWDKKQINKKGDKDEAKIKAKGRKGAEFKTARIIDKSVVSVPSDSMMSKHEVVGVHFIASSKNSKPPKGQGFSVFDQIRKNAAQHLLEDMSPLHSYDQVELIDQLRMPKKGKEPILKETDNAIYLCDEADTSTIATSTSTEPDHQISLRESQPVRREIDERDKKKKKYQKR